MRRVRDKLASRRGASLTFALLLFLICSIASVAVIVAGTTASGRMRNIPDIDGRYYAVSSAAELLGKTLDGQSVTVVRTTTEKVVTDSSAPDEPEVQSEGTTTINGQSTPLGSQYATLLTDAAEWLLDDDVEEDFFGQPLALTASGTLPEGVDAESALAALSVQIYEKMERNGAITFYVSKSAGTGASNAGAYTLRLTFAADRKDNEVTHTDYGTPVISESGYKTTDIKTATKTTTIKWTLIGIVKDVMPAAASVEPSAEPTGEG